MTTPPSFPTLPGQGWSVHKKPTWNTLVASHVSGREVRAPQYQYPLWEFELVFDGLSDSPSAWPGLGAQTLQSLLGLYLQCQGQLSPFLYFDPSDNYVTGQAVATGDGFTEQFVLGRTLGGFLEPVGWVTNLVQVSLAGDVASPESYGLTTPNTLVFETAPANGAAITATFEYSFQCRFLEDTIDFENFMQNLWSLGSLKFRSVRSNY